MKNTELAVFGTLVIWGVIFALVFIVWSQPVHEYDNEVHREFCQLAESREASEDYLISRNCK